MSTCKHGSTAPDQVLDALHESQAGVRDGVYIWRHKCCECAFQKGVEYGRLPDPTTPTGTAHCKTANLSGPFEIFEDLPLSQGTKGRHKCAICAFHAGFERGREMGVKASG